MEIASPVWNSETNSYTFKFYETTMVAVSEKPVYIKSGNTDAITLPDISDEHIINTFIDKTHKWFQTPLRADSVRKRLRHILEARVDNNICDDWYTIFFKPAAMIVSSKEFVLKWEIEQINNSSPTISADFLAPTPRARSPEPDASSNEKEKELRTINIQNSVETLVPIGDLPLSDLPPLSFEDNSDATKSEKKRHIREARLRVALAKLKAKRMEERYYMKYGEPADDSESSYLTSDSDSDEYFQQLH